MLYEEAPDNNVETSVKDLEQVSVCNKNFYSLISQQCYYLVQ